MKNIGILLMAMMILMVSCSKEESLETGGSGGSGVVILKYPENFTITIGAGLTGTTAAPSGGFKVTTITAGTGNVSWA
jgi:hypothetical protein